MTTLLNRLEDSTVPARIRIANCSGFYGDRLSAAQEMVDGGPIDVLTGDWLAEFTMLVLAKDRQRDPQGGYARTFVTQMRHVMGACLDRGIKVVSNAGGLNPAGCARAVEEVAATLGLRPTIAVVEGDDLLGRWDELRRAGQYFRNAETGEPIGDHRVITANAYMGAWGIATALQEGADIVVTGRVSDASLAVGPSAWFHGWQRSDWDRIAGAVVAGHLIECGPQVCGGNFSFFHDVPGIERPAFPIAEVAEDGSAIITKHPGHGGCVTVGTVTAQLLYEIGSPRYANPDVVARFDTVELSEVGPDRVMVSGTRGEPAPSTSKVCVNVEGGYRSTVEILLTGLDIDAKASVAERALWGSFPNGREEFDEVVVQLDRGGDIVDAPRSEAAVARLRITVKDRDEGKLGRAFGAKVVELGLSSFPGLIVGPSPPASRFDRHWPTSVDAHVVTQEVVIGDRRLRVAPPPAGSRPPVDAPVPATAPGPPTVGPTVQMPLGRVVGARSGDKGGNANVGVWARTAEAYRWLARELTVDRFRQLVPDSDGLPVQRYELPNVLALNFVVVGLLGEGLASSTRLDPQAKALGEYLRSRTIAVPESLVDGLTPVHGR